MNLFKRLVTRINDNAVARNVVMAVCGVLVFVFFVSICLNVFTRHNRYETVPDFRGQLIDDASHAAHKASLQIEINDSLFVPAYEGGMVLEQTPAPGTKVKSGRRIFVTVNSFRQKIVEIPYVTGFSLRQAKNNLEIAGIEIDKLIYQSDIANNYILEQRFEGRAITATSRVKAEVGSGVTLVVGHSSDAPPAVIPKVVGFPLREAKSRLWEGGMNVGKIDFDEGIDVLSKGNARVYAQSPGQGYKVAPGTVVNLRLTLDEEKIASGSAASDRSARTVISQQQAEDSAAVPEPEAAKP